MKKPKKPIAMSDDLNADDIFAQLRDLQGADAADAADAAGVASFTAPLSSIPLPDPAAEAAQDAAAGAGHVNVDVMQGPLAATPQAALASASSAANLMGQFMPIAAMQAQIQAVQMGPSSAAPLPPQAGGAGSLRPG